MGLLSAGLAAQVESVYCVIPCRSWQVVQFDPLPVTFIKIVGTHNTANEVSVTICNPNFSPVKHNYLYTYIPIPLHVTSCIVLSTIHPDQAHSRSWDVNEPGLGHALSVHLTDCMLVQ